MMTELIEQSIIKALKLPDTHHMVILEDVMSGGYRFILVSDAHPMAEEIFHFHPYTDLPAEVQKIRDWLKPILNPNLKMFSHVKF